MKPNHALFVQRDPADSVIYLESGRAKPTAVSHNGKEATITLPSARDFVGEESLATAPRLRLSKVEPAEMFPHEASLNDSALPIFQQGWWLGISRGLKPLKLEEVKHSGQIVGRLSYVTRRSRLGFPLGEIPHWTHLAGPWLSQNLYPLQKQEVLEKLVSRLPKRVSFSFTCHPCENDAALITNVFQNAGFNVAVQKTFSQTPDDIIVMSRINVEQRKNIVRAEKKLEITRIDVDTFVEFYGRNLVARGLVCYNPLSIARDLIAAGLQRTPPQAEILAAGRRNRRLTDPACPLDAAIACVWDSERYYYFMSTRRTDCYGNPECKPNADAVKLLIVHAMQHARDMGLTFDADGVTTDGAETLYRKILKIPELEYRLLLRREGTLYTRFLAVTPHIARWTEKWKTSFSASRGGIRYPPQASQ